MAVIDELQVVDGYFLEGQFIMVGLSTHSVYGKYKAEGLRSLARLIGDDPFSFVTDNKKYVRIPVELNDRIRYELNLIADELDKGEDW